MRLEDGDEIVAPTGLAGPQPNRSWIYRAVMDAISSSWLHASAEEQSSAGEKSWEGENKVGLPNP